MRKISPFVEKDLYPLIPFTNPETLPVFWKALITVVAHIPTHQVWGCTSLPSSLPFPISKQPQLEVCHPQCVLYQWSELGFSPSARTLPRKSSSTHPWCRRTEQQCVALTTLGQLYYSTFRMHTAWMRGFMPCWEDSPTPKGKWLLAGLWGWSCFHWAPVA